MPGITHKVQDQQGGAQRIGRPLCLGIGNAMQLQDRAAQWFGLIAAVEHQVAPAGAGRARYVTPGGLYQPLAPLRVEPSLALHDEQAQRSDGKLGRLIAGIGYMALKAGFDTVDEELAGFIYKIGCIGNGAQGGQRIVQRLQAGPDGGRKERRCRQPMLPERAVGLSGLHISAAGSRGGLFVLHCRLLWASMTGKSTILSPCGHLVRQHDSDRFLCALMAPAAQRERLFTLLAFNNELAKVREIVSEPVLGQMRLQWWREVMEEGRSPAHEVGRPLSDLLKAEPLLLPLLLELVEARERDLSDAPFENIEQLALYARATSAPLLAAMDGGSADIATGYALVGLLRSGRAGTVPASDLAGLARKLLAGPATGQACYWRVVARLYLRQFEKAGNNPAASRFVLPHPWRGIALLWASLTR